MVGVTLEGSGSVKMSTAGITTNEARWELHWNAQEVYECPLEQDLQITLG